MTEGTKEANEGSALEKITTLQGTIDSSGAPIFSVDREYCYTSFNQAHAASMQAASHFDPAVVEAFLDTITSSGIAKAV